MAHKIRNFLIDLVGGISLVVVWVAIPYFLLGMGAW